MACPNKVVLAFGQGIICNLQAFEAGDLSNDHEDEQDHDYAKQVFYPSQRYDPLATQPCGPHIQYKVQWILERLTGMHLVIGIRMHNYLMTLNQIKQLHRLFLLIGSKNNIR